MKNALRFAYFNTFDATMKTIGFLYKKVVWQLGAHQTQNHFFRHNLKHYKRNGIS